uniref:Cytochrome P450 n=1 Tax=Oryza brachyantha TaxID=4533 RepID=J3L191_ORYBR
MADASSRSYLYLCLAVVSLLAVLLARRRRRSDTARDGHGGGLRLPPGPWQLPVIGSLHHMVGKPPHRAMHDLARRHGAPGMALQLGGVPTVVISSPEAAQEVLRTNDAVFATRRLSCSMGAATKGRSMSFAPYGDYWRMLRKVAVTELLCASRVASFRSIREEEVAAWLRALAAGERGVELEMQAELTRLVANSTVRTVVGDGDRCAHRDEFLRQLERANKLATVFNPVDLWPSSRLAARLSGGVRKFVGCVDEIRRIVDGIIQEHLEKPRGGREDFLDVLLRIHKEGELQVPLDMESIHYLVADLFAGGSDTSATLLEWTLAELIRNPKVMAKATAEVRDAFAAAGAVSEGRALGELRYLQLVIKESLRLHPPVPLLLPRECQEPSRVLGYDVPRGTQVLVNVFALSRDERCWPAAEEFLPERFGDGEAAAGLDFRGADMEFVPFGAGRRMCPGMALVLANTELTIASLLFHFDWEAPGIADPTKLDMTEEFGVTMRRKNKLLLRPVLRIPVPGA